MVVKTKVRNRIKEKTKDVGRLIIAVALQTISLDKVQVQNNVQALICIVWSTRQ